MFALHFLLVICSGKIHHEAHITVDANGLSEEMQHENVHSHGKHHILHEHRHTDKHRSNVKMMKESYPTQQQDLNDGQLLLQPAGQHRRHAPHHRNHGHTVQDLRYGSFEDESLQEKIQDPSEMNIYAREVRGGDVVNSEGSLDMIDRDVLSEEVDKEALLENGDSKGSERGIDGSDGNFVTSIESLTISSQNGQPWMFLCNPQQIAAYKSRLLNDDKTDPFGGGVGWRNEMNSDSDSSAMSNNSMPQIPQNGTGNSTHSGNSTNISQCEEMVIRNAALIDNPDQTVEAAFVECMDQQKCEIFPWSYCEVDTTKEHHGFNTYANVSLPGARGFLSHGPGNPIESSIRGEWCIASLEQDDDGTIMPAECLSHCGNSLQYCGNSTDGSGSDVLTQKPTDEQGQSTYCATNVWTGRCIGPCITHDATMEEFLTAYSNSYGETMYAYNSENHARQYCLSVVVLLIFLLNL